MHIDLKENKFKLLLYYIDYSFQSNKISSFIKLAANLAWEII